MRILIVVLACFLCVTGASQASASDQLKYGPAPAWAKPIPIPSSDPAYSGPVEPLLFSSQEHLGPEAHSRYAESAIKVRSPQGLSAAGMLAAAWDPATSDMTVVRAEILRDGQAIDLLAAGDRFSVLRRERNLSEAVIDGTLTAILEAKGLRVGDIVHLVTVIDMRDPVVGSHRETLAAIGEGKGTIGRLHFRQVWPEGAKLRFKASDAYAKHMRQTKTALGTEIEFDVQRFEAAKAPAGAPARFLFPYQLEITAFEDWSGVSRLSAKAFAEASRLSPTSPLKAELEKIRAAHATPEARTLAALQLVEHDVRYLAMMLNAGGLVPAAADDTWTRRFGDCKAKTALLIALLTELGVKAEPALVSSAGGAAMDERLPRIGAFDHVIVRAEIGGRTYWLDPTRPTDKSLISISGLPFAFALPVRIDGAQLQKIDWAAPAKPLREDLQETDISNGVEGKAPSRLVVLLRGDEALGLDLVLGQMTRSEAESGLKEHFARDIAWLDVEKVDYRWDRAEDGLRVEFAGKGKFGWQREGSRWTVGVTDAVDEKYEERDEGADAGAPYGLTFPYYYAETIRVLTPKGKVRRDLLDADHEMSAGGVRYLRKSRLEDGLVEVTQSQQVLTREVSAEEALSFNRKLATTPFSRMAMLTYGEDGVNVATETQLRDLVRLGRQNLERGNPEEALLYLNRGLKLDPANAEALFARISVLLTLRKDLPQALADARTLTRLQPNSGTIAMEAGVLLEVGQANQALDRADDALKEDPKQRSALGTKLLALVQLGRPAEAAFLLDKLADLGGAPKDLAAYVAAMQAWVAVRPAEEQAAYGRALAAEPQSASARILYGAQLTRTDPARARGQFEQALLIHPNYPLVYRQRFLLSMREQNYEAALQDLDLWKAADPAEEVVGVLRADVLAIMKSHEKAIEEYAALSKRDPLNPMHRNQLCWYRAVAGVGLQQALADCGEALRLAPNYPQALDSRGLVNLKLGRYAEAIADYDASLKGRTYAGSIYGRGLAKRKAGDEAGAKADLARALQIDPNLPRTFEEYGLPP